jgi:hypothetical protein
MDNMDRVRIAYKKLKASVFFDKTQSQAMPYMLTPLLC